MALVLGLKPIDTPEEGEASSGEPRIQVAWLEARLEFFVVGHADDAGDQEARDYELAVERTGRAGTFRTYQAGALRPGPDRVVTVRLDVQSGDTIRARLVVRQHGEVVAHDQWERTL
jgi:hypothetical protein